MRSAIDAPCAGQLGLGAFAEGDFDVVAPQIRATGSLRKRVASAGAHAHAHQAALAMAAGGLLTAVLDAGAFPDDHFDDAVRERGRLLDQHQRCIRGDDRQNMLESARQIPDAHRLAVAARRRMDDDAAAEQCAVQRRERLVRHVEGGAEMLPREFHGARFGELGHFDRRNGCHFVAWARRGNVSRQRARVPALGVRMPPRFGTQARQPCSFQGAAQCLPVAPRGVARVRVEELPDERFGVSRRASHSPSLRVPRRAAGPRSGRCGPRRARGRGPAPRGSAGAGSG